jgi:hypothetical protein
MKDSYFSRSATWQNMNGRLVVHDSFSPLAPRMVTMEPWYETIFMAADGVHKIQEFIEAMGQQYENGVPEGLSEQICGIIQTLLEEGIISIHEHPKELPKYFACDFFQISPKEKEELMRKDGLIK